MPSPSSSRAPGSAGGRCCRSDRRATATRRTARCRRSRAIRSSSTSTRSAMPDRRRRACPSDAVDYAAAAAFREKHLRRAFQARGVASSARALELPRVRRARGGLARRLRALRRAEARARRRRVDALGARRAQARPAALERARKEHAAGDRAREVRAVEVRRAVARAACILHGPAASGSSATCPSSSRTTAPTCGSTASSSSSTTTGVPHARRRRAARLLQRDRPALGQSRSTAGHGSRRTGYAWWIDRVRASLERFDAVRLDHFIGFARYWRDPRARADGDERAMDEGPGPRACSTR